MLSIGALSVCSALLFTSPVAIYNWLLIRLVRLFVDAVRPCGLVLDNSVSLKNLDRGSTAGAGINVPKTATGINYCDTSAFSQI